MTQAVGSPSAGREIVLYVEENASDGMDNVLQEHEIPVPAVKGRGARAGTREKLQVRGKGRGRGTKKGASEDRNDSFPVEARGGRAAARGRGRRGRGRGAKGRGEQGDGVAAGVADGSGDSSSGESAELSGDSQGGIHGANVSGRVVALRVEAETGAPFEETPEFPRFSSQVTIIPNWPFHVHWAISSAEVQLAFDDSPSQDQSPSLTLPLFKSAMTFNSLELQKGMHHPCNDIVLNVGGSVWALDWCPERPGWVHSACDKLEFLAVGAHPSACPYNRLGQPLEGPGLIQIWSLDFLIIDKLSTDKTEVEGGAHRTGAGRDSAWRASEKSSSGGKNVGRGAGRSRMRGSMSDISADLVGNILLLDDVPERQGMLSIVNGDETCDMGMPPSGKRPRKLKESARARVSSTDAYETRFPQWRKGVGPAKMILGLAHDGVVTWDAKWQPVGENPGDEHELTRLGILAVLLGDGSIQVLDVPLPSVLAQSSRGRAASQDPLTVRMGPIFSCSNLQSGGHKSIPLSLEWSTWEPHNLILVGFHDATVGVWKFSSNPQQPETRPLIFFTADTLPLRSVAWAPNGSGSAGKHIFATTGHSGWVKFWDIRDPFRPLWDLQVSRGCIHSMDWLQWPRCLLMTLDDGTIRILSLDNSASQTPVTGEPWRGTHTQGLSCYLCSSLPIWHVQVSRSTGLVAYGGASGSVLQFQLTEKAILKEGCRSREPHYLCGAYATESESGPITLTSPKSTSPAQMKKSSTEWSSRPRTKRGFLATCTLDNESRQGSGAMKVIEFPSTTEDSPGPRLRKKHSKAIGKIRNKDPSQASCFQKGYFDSDNQMAADDKLALVPLDAPLLLTDAPEQNLPKTKNTAENFPCRKVSVHRLRWNCNKNRQNWLAYGGAAGIVRCQQVFSMKKKKKGDF